MTDISKCQGKGCPVKKFFCYRFTAPHGVWQSYLKPNNPDKCEHFWDNKTRGLDERKRVKK